MHIFRTINSIFSSNTWTIYNELSNYVWLVDAGDVEVIIRQIESDNKKIKGVLLTHAHFDHIYGLNKLLEHNPDLSVYIGQEDKDALYSGKMNMSKYHEEGEFIFSGDNVYAVSDGECVNLWEGVKAEVISMPGHTPGCITYIIDRYIFTGDAYIPEIKPVIYFSRSNKKDAEISIIKAKKLIALKGLIVCPGHLNDLHNL